MKNKSAGEHPQSVEDAFDGKIWETEPVSGVFLLMSLARTAQRCGGDEFSLRTTHPRRG